MFYKIMEINPCTESERLHIINVCYTAAVLQINFMLGLNFHCPIIVFGYGDIENNGK